MSTVNLSRKDTARLLESLLKEVAEDIHSKQPSKLASRLREVFATQGLEIPRPCNGEAHSNPHVDNCGVCMPNWGWVSQTVKIR